MKFVIKNEPTNVYAILVEGSGGLYNTIEWTFNKEEATVFNNQLEAMFPCWMIYTGSSFKLDDFKLVREDLPS